MIERHRHDVSLSQLHTERLLCDNTRAREWAGWEPQVTLEEGLARTAAWAEEHHGTLKAGSYQV
ncbi:MAG: hypothetical protein ACR2HA_11235 [Nocardioides sp.]